VTLNDDWPDGTRPPVGFGQALRISNAVTSGSFGDQAFSPGLTEPAGETARKHFEASFDVATTSDAVQPGLAISVSPDNGHGARMSYLRFEDHADGVRVFFDGANAAGGFDETRIATLEPASAHSIRFLINFRHADDVKVFIDGKKAISGTTGEPLQGRRRPAGGTDHRCCSARRALAAPKRSVPLLDRQPDHVD
jgi:hypothetical protein